MAKDEGRLYGGHVQNPREISSVQVEVAGYKEKRSAAEDELLQVMLDVDESRASLEEKRKALASVEERHRARKAELTAEREALIRELEALSGKRAEALQPVRADEMSRYERLRSEKRGRAVAPLLEGNVCGGCRVALPLSRAHEARTSQTLVYCTSCGRVLYSGR